jgi:predicted enzyme related to lactoylglutathione lyase
MANGLKGRFMWYELLTTDPKAAQDFYTNTLGWTVTMFESLGMPYPMWTRSGVPIGGAMELPDEAKQAGAPPHWLMYVGADDVDATHRSALEVGGRSYVAPRDIPTVGRFAVLADPQGAVFALYNPQHPAPAPDGAPQDGDFSWHELATTDQAAAFEFYSRLFGWRTIEENQMERIGIYRTFGRDLTQEGGMFTMPADMQMPPHWWLYVKVADVERTAETVKARGGRVLNGPVRVPGGHLIAQCMDPQGAAFALHQAP